MITKINEIKNFKCYQDFRWEKYCRLMVNKQTRETAEAELDKRNIFFGENGSGKSTIVDIIKSYCRFKNFNSTPEYINLELDTGNCLYQNKKWTHNAKTNDFLFFDSDFVNNNIHTNGIRETTAHSHAQNSGNLIVQLDGEANKLRQIYEDSMYKFDKFKESNVETAKYNIKNKSAVLFNKYKDLNENELKELSEVYESKKQKMHKEIETLKKYQSNVNELNKINIIASINMSFELFDFAAFHEVLSRQIDKESANSAQKEIYAYIKGKTRFIEEGLSLLEPGRNQYCPFCKQDIKDSLSLITVYQSYFDEAYKTEQQKLQLDKQNIIYQLESIINKTKDAQTLMLLRQKDIENLFLKYNLPRKSSLWLEPLHVTEQEIEQIINVRNAFMNALKNQDYSLDDKNSHVLNSIIGSLNRKINIFNRFINITNKNINLFRSSLSKPEQVTNEINSKINELGEIDKVLHFLIKDNLTKYKKRMQYDKTYKKLESKVLKSRENYYHYLQLEMPKLIIEDMLHILNLFNLQFELHHESAEFHTREYPFSFRVIDKDGNNRDIKNGLSEGERQILSLSFFLALLKNTDNKNQKTVIFDDPVTSLDSRNLKILSDVLNDITDYQQLFIFTHHPLFHKYLLKSKKNDTKTFTVLRNAKHAGGSFIYCDSYFSLFQELAKCEDEILTEIEAQNFNMEKFIFEKGHWLRLSLERLIKKDFLMWDKENNFNEIVNNLDSSKIKITKLTDQDFVEIKKIWDYCNWSNYLHEDKQLNSSKDELIEHIDKYIALFNKVFTSPQHPHLTI